jgi:SAM-dependent methyltransferase
MTTATGFCPCCDGSVESFLPFGVRPRPNARCPRCGALERHRLLTLFLRSGAVTWRPNPRVLHIAPEASLKRALQRVSGIRYVPADLNPSHGVRLDITALPFGSASLDALVCNHVLEHVPDDRQGMREFRRVLRRGGWAILQSPVDKDRADTFEDATVVDPADRERLFGQWDHVRVYGRDYADRLRGAGFDVRVVLPSDWMADMDAATIARLGLRPAPIYLCYA